MRRAVTALALLVFAAGAAWSVRAGLADYWARQGSIAGAERAAALATDHAAWQILLAILVADTDSGRATSALRRAAALNPRDAQTWISLGLRTEIDGDLHSAEQLLLRASEVDKTYLPRWTLANYYARRGNAEAFWHWAALAARSIPGDPVPLFRLCGRMAEDGNLIERLKLENPSLQASFLRYLLDNSHLDVARNSIERVLSNGRTMDTPLLLAVCERFIGQGFGPQATNIWNRLAAAKSIAAEPLDPTGGLTLTNGNFAAEPLNLGFDWRLPPVEGVSASRLQQPSGLRLIFTGKQQEKCDPLLQWLPVEPKKEYALTWRYSTHDIATGAGPRWIVTGTAGEILEQSDNLSSESGAAGRLVFTAPRESRLVRLALNYQRKPGTQRIAGSLALRELRVAALSKGASSQHSLQALRVIPETNSSGKRELRATIAE